MEPRIGRLRKRPEFLRVARGGRKWVTPGLVLQARPRRMDQVSDQAQVQGEPDPDIRVGFTASRKVGGAVVRNRARRRLKAACAAVLPSCGTAGRDYVIIARKSTATRPYGRLVDDLRTALKRIEDDRRSGQSGRRVENDRRSGHRQSRRSGGDGKTGTTQQ